VCAGSGLAAEFGGRVHVLLFPDISSLKIDNIAYRRQIQLPQGAA
jgi:hypothetical protein